MAILRTGQLHRLLPQLSPMKAEYLVVGFSHGFFQRYGRQRCFCFPDSCPPTGGGESNFPEWHTWANPATSISWVY